MSCCSVSGTDKFFSKNSGYYARKFRRHGIDRPQQIIVGLLRSSGVAGLSILEAGCGVGGLHLTLLKEGAATAFGVEVSEGMIGKARELATEMGLEDRVRYHQGDFGEGAGPAPESDLVLLDKVLCCYADPAVLIRTSAAKCRERMAVSYPRDAFIPRFLFTVYAFVGRSFRWSFHPMYHEPGWLDGMILREGFRELGSDHTMVWQVKVFERGEGPGGRG